MFYASNGETRFNAGAICACPTVSSFLVFSFSSERNLNLLKALLEKCPESYLNVLPSKEISVTLARQLKSSN